ncbi:MAG: ABC transporter substrate-binding protein [bacterium]
MKQANRGRLLAAGSALMMALGVAGCGQKAESPGKAGGERVYRIAFASFGPDEAADIAIKGYLEGLRDEGFVTGRNLEVIQRHAGGEIASLPLLMQSLEGEGLDLIVPMTSPGVAAACSRVKRTPVVFVYTYDPIAAGAGKDFDHHLPNITGVASFPAIGKTMAAVRELVPNLKTLGTVYNASEVNSVRAVREARQVLEPAGIKLEEVTISTTADVLLSTQALLSRRVEAIWVTGDNTVLQALEGVLGPASRARIPVVLNDTEFVDRGAVAAIGISWTESGRVAGRMAARVLRGESPADIPIVNVAETKILVNRKQAALIGVTLPPSMDLPTGKRP